MDPIQSEIAEWRTLVERGPGLEGRDVDELEAHLRDQIVDLTDMGLEPDEAFLIAVRRMGSLDALSHEYARQHSGRLWMQLMGSDQEQPADSGWTEALPWAVGAAVVFQAVLLAAGFPDDLPSWLLRTASLFVAPFLAGYFARRRGLSFRSALRPAMLLAVLAAAATLYPFSPGGSTEVLVVAHMPVVVWFLIAHPYTGGELRSHERRMDFVRFTGEWLIYYTLIALGGVVLVVLMRLILAPTVVDAEKVMQWVLPMGSAGAVVVAAWLVESKQRVVENMAPVLTMLFTPLFALMLAGATVAYLVSGLGEVFDRELLGIFDALLVVVFGLVLYGMSARDPFAPPGWADRIQLVAVVAALVLDVMVLATMVARIAQEGFTPNRTAVVGLNLLLFVSLAGTAWLLARFVAGRAAFHRVERWQTACLPTFALWAGIVVVAFPPLFGFI